MDLADDAVTDRMCKLVDEIRPRVRLHGVTGSEESRQVQRRSGSRAASDVKDYVTAIASVSAKRDPSGLGVAFQRAEGHTVFIGMPDADSHFAGHPNFDLQNVLYVKRFFGFRFSGEADQRFRRKLAESFPQHLHHFTGRVLALSDDRPIISLQQNPASAGSRLHVLIALLPFHYSPHCSAIGECYTWKPNLWENRPFRYKSNTRATLRVTVMATPGDLDINPARQEAEKVYDPAPIVRPEHLEDSLTRMIEQQTAKVPSNIFLAASLGAIGCSLYFFLRGERDTSILVGMWAPTLLTMGVYNKLVKMLMPR